MPGKPKLNPPTTARHFPTDPQVTRSKLISLIIFVLLAVGAVGVIVILPDSISSQQGRQDATQKDLAPHAPPSTESSPSQALLAQAKIEAEKLLGEVLKHQARLENSDVKIWGEQQLTTSYPAALAKLKDADEHFNKRRFDLSVKAYRETIAVLEQLSSSRPERMQQALQAGTEALEVLDSEKAKQAFEVALAIDPVHTQAQKGLRRAQNLQQMLKKVEMGQAHESNRALNDAQAAYTEATDLDPDYAPARNHLKRVEKLILDRDYQHAMSQALAALNQKDYAKAQLNVKHASKLRPGTAEVREIERQLKTAMQDVSLKRLRQQATKFERDEAWDKAIQTYDKALQIDNSANFAIQGKLRAEEFAGLNQQMDHYLLQPERLQSNKPMTHARKVLNAATAVSDAGPLLRDKGSRLRQLIDDANKKAPVVVRSDDKTDVMILQVGRFGRLTEKQLMLRPGHYTALGTRSGYRDVRLTFVVPLSGEQTIVVVSCEELI